MASKQERDRVIQQVVGLLYEAGAYNWPVQDKGVLTAAVKLQLQENAAGKSALKELVGNGKAQGQTED